MVERMLIGLLARGHLLLEGVPGVAKTLAVRTLADVVGGSFSRLQFTPDLMPGDITGTRVWRASTETFDVERGPIFANLVLADEINRAPAKVQSALLEAMAEKQVSIAGTSHALPDPFLVLATQNPVESEGVYRLPEAQRDRFLLKVDVPYPTGQEEFTIVHRMSVDPPRAEQVFEPDRRGPAAEGRRRPLRAPLRGVVPGQPDDRQPHPRPLRARPPRRRHRARRQPARLPRHAGRRPRARPAARPLLRAARRHRRGRLRRDEPPAAALLRRDRRRRRPPPGRPRDRRGGAAAERRHPRGPRPPAASPPSRPQQPPQASDQQLISAPGDR